MSADLSLQSSALVLASAGFAVFPVKAGTKRPLVRWGEGATADLAAVARYWKDFPTASIGVACRKSALVVVDIDGDEGEASWAELTRYVPPITTLTSTTGRGRHLWFRAPGEPAVRNSAGLLGRGIDVRAGGEDGYGGFAVAPPSWHKSGRRYEWSVRAPITALPTWLLERLKPRPVIAPALQGSLAASPDRVLAGLERVIREAQAGERNSRLYWACRRLSEHAAEGRLVLDEAAVALQDAARAVGLDDREIAQTMGSAFRSLGVAA
jgi:hypothetical protein